MCVYAWTHLLQGELQCKQAAPVKGVIVSALHLRWVQLAAV